MNRNSELFYDSQMLTLKKQYLSEKFKKVQGKINNLNKKNFNSFSPQGTDLP